MSATDPVEIPNLTAGALNALFLPPRDVAGYKWLTIQVTGDANWATGSELRVQHSLLPNGPWKDNVYGMKPGQLAQVGFSMITSNDIYCFPILARYMQVIMDQYGGTGTASGQVDLSEYPPFLPVSSAIGWGSTVIPSGKMTDTLIATGAGQFGGVGILSTGAGTPGIFDNTTSTGKQIATVFATSGLGIFNIAPHGGVKFFIGLTVAGGAPNPGMIVFWNQ